jgi:hypothetical protein
MVGYPVGLARWLPRVLELQLSSLKRWGGAHLPLCYYLRRPRWPRWLRRQMRK